MEAIDITIKEIKPIGVIKEEIFEKKEKNFLLLLWVRLIKNGKEKFLFFCIRNYCYYDWPLNELIVHSYIKNDRGEIAGSIVFRDHIPFAYILNNLLYINAEIYTRFSDNLYKKNDALTKENVLTKEEELYIKRIICSHIYNLNDKKKEYYRQQIERLLTGNLAVESKNISQELQILKKKSYIYPLYQRKS